MPVTSIVEEDKVEIQNSRIRWQGNRKKHEEVRKEEKS
jgi:hypothetical protein